MMTQEFRTKVRAAILDDRKTFGGSNAAYAKRLGISSSIFSRLFNGETERIMDDGVWLTIGRELQVSLKEDNWKVARTRVYTEIEDNLTFCQELSKSMILVDDCGIGKTFCAKRIVRKKQNAFYFDCSQSKTKQQFIRQLAKTLGVDSLGKYVTVKNNLKYYLSNMLEKPLVVLDEAGDLEYTAFLELKELWNATDGVCAWYMMGADGLREKVERGINGKKVGFAEIFSRFSDDFIKLVPTGKDDRNAFYTQLIKEVASVNVVDQSKIAKYTKQCLNKGATLRYLETLIKIEA